MMTMDARHQFKCPSCQQGGGVPYRVVTQGPRQVVVSVRCSSCQHDWDVEQKTMAGRLSAAVSEQP
jgi:transposase-like protein